MRVWYAVRAVHRAAQLGCLALALCLLGMTHLWTDAAGFLVPMVVASMAAASGFAFDDPAAAVTAVTPRARWAQVTRLLSAVVPLLGWAVLSVGVPGAVLLDRPRWLLVGAAACLLAAGLGAVAASRQSPRPGGSVASAVALMALLPLLVGPALGWDPVYPLGTFPDDVLLLWGGFSVVGVGLCAAAVWARPPSWARGFRR